MQSPQSTSLYPYTAPGTSISEDTFKYVSGIVGDDITFDDGRVGSVVDGVVVVPSKFVGEGAVGGLGAEVDVASVCTLVLAVGKSTCGPKDGGIVVTSIFSFDMQDDNSGVTNVVASIVAPVGYVNTSICGIDDGDTVVSVDEELSKAKVVVARLIVSSLLEPMSIPIMKTKRAKKLFKQQPLLEIVC